MLLYFLINASITMIYKSGMVFETGSWLVGIFCKPSFQSSSSSNGGNAVTSWSLSLALALALALTLSLSLSLSLSFVLCMQNHPIVLLKEIRYCLDICSKNWIEKISQQPVEMKRIFEENWKFETRKSWWLWVPSPKNPFRLKFGHCLRFDGHVVEHLNGSWVRFSGAPTLFLKPKVWRTDPRDTFPTADFKLPPKKIRTLCSSKA